MYNIILSAVPNCVSSLVNKPSDHSTLITKILVFAIKLNPYLNTDNKKK